MPDETGDSTGSAAGGLIWTPDRDAIAPPGHLRLLTYNIQTGLDTAHYGHYVTRAWRHALPHKDRRVNLDRMALLMRGYDFVAVQEADAGSLRSGRLDLLEYLARRAGYPHWGHAVTRDLQPFARHSLGYLSRFAPARVEELVLPSLIPGRRALRIDLGTNAAGLTLMVTHLSLSHGARRQQLDYLTAQVPPDGPVVLLGDLNCEPQALQQHAALRESRLCLPHAPATFPSWRPRRRINHILVSKEVNVHRIEALPHAISDHLPLAAEISLAR